MSVEHMALVFEADGLDASEAAVLLAMTNFTDAHGYCYPSVARLAWMTKLSDRTVIRVRKGLEAKNLLVHQRRTSAAGDPTSNVYRVNLGKLAAMRRRNPDDFGDNLMALEFEPEHNSKTGSDQLKCHGDTTPPHGDTTPPRTVTPPPPHGVTQSITDPSADSSSSGGGTSAAAVEVEAQQDDDDREAIDTTDAAALVDALECPLKLRPSPKQRTVLVKLAVAALAAGWPAEALRGRLSAVLGPDVRSAYAVWRKALSELPEPPEPPETPAVVAKPLAAHLEPVAIKECDNCDSDGWRFDGDFEIVRCYHDAN